MAKFNAPASKPKYVEAKTHNDGGAVRPSNPLTELRFTAVVTFVGEDTFYESAEDRQKRIVDLTHAATKVDTTGVAQLVADLRSKFMIRGASVVVASEYLRAYEGRGPHPRSVIAAACQRADEPAEFIAYWYQHYGRSIPRAMKMGLSDALGNLITQFSALKYNGKERAIRLADVIELVHPTPFSADQSALFKALLDERHRGKWDEHPELLERLPVIANHLYLARMPEDRRRQHLSIVGPKALSDAGFTWERLSSWLPGGMDAQAWEAVIPRMGVFALIRNLRNFDDANISEAAHRTVVDKITNAADVAGAKILPMRAYQAYNAAKSDNWKRALGQTLELASGNVAPMHGSLLLIDTSGSMRDTLSAKSKLMRVEAAALQAITIAKHSSNCDVVIYGQTSAKLDLDMRMSVLALTQQVARQVGVVGHNTMGHTAIARHFDPQRHERVVMFTDDQQTDSKEFHDQKGQTDYWGRTWPDPVDISHVPEVITFNVGGYGTQSTWGKGRITVAGLSDQIFAAVRELI